MRIIAGTHRGRRLAAPPGRGTRPMLDRVREALFSSVTDWLPQARVLDLYAGSGSLGLEAASRGAQFVRMVERGAGARRVLEDNVQLLGLEGVVQVQAGSALDPARWAPPAGSGDTDWADLVFLDPPYPHSEQEPERGKLLAAVEQLVEEVLAPQGVAVLHTSPRALDERSFPARWDVAKRVYGRSALWYLQPFTVAEDEARDD